jgi:hypothetical protein
MVFIVVNEDAMVRIIIIILCIFPDEKGDGSSEYRHAVLYQTL